MIYAATIFLSSFLLFLVQPLIARLILPWFGGTAAVWTTCMLFFQSLLLAGYAYAHATNALLKPRSIWWSGLRKTPVYDGERLVAGNSIRGPAVVETADATVVVHPGRTLRVDALGNFEITFRQARK